MGAMPLASSRERSGGSRRPWCCLRRCSPSSSRASRDPQHPTPEAEAFVMADKSDDAKARAEARFNRELQRSRQDDALKAEIAAQARTVDKKTERLRALRLAKEAGEGAAKPAKPDGGHTRKDKGKPPPP